MATKARALGSLLKEFRDSIATGSGLNLVSTVENLIKAGDTETAASILKRAGTAGGFGGKFDNVEKAALKGIASRISSTPMESKLYGALGQASKQTPLVLGSRNFPKRMADLGFQPLSGINLNNPTMTVGNFTGNTRSRFIDEGANNLIAAWNLNPKAAQEYATFYNRTRDQLEATGVPIDRIGGAWATLSSQADPVFNAELLRRIVRNPEELTTSELNQRLALEFLGGKISDPAEALGRGKRFNFMMNSIDPDNPAYLTADTRYAQNLQGVKNIYKRAPFAGMFQPFNTSDRYNKIYIQPGLEAARRLGVTPGAAQAGAWGNWRSELFDLPADLPPGLLDDLANLDYNPEIYIRALRRLG